MAVTDDNTDDNYKKSPHEEEIDRKYAKSRRDTDLKMFSCAALLGFMSSDPAHSRQTPQELAARSFAIAEAMLKEIEAQK